MSFFSLGYSLTNINNILERDHFTLEELLDEQDVVQECSKDNKQLVEFLSKPPVILQMLEFAIGAPDENADEAVRYKYPSVATDILSVGVHAICQGLTNTEKVWKEKTLMHRLWSFLDNPAPLNPLLASYFSKIASVLLHVKSTDVLAFVRQDPTILDKLLHNMGTSAVMELLISIFGDRDLKRANGVMEWLTEEKVVRRLVSHVSSSYSTDMQGNASQALFEVVSLNKLSIEFLGPDPIVTQLYDREIMELLVQQLVVPEATGALLCNGIEVFLALMNAAQLPVTGEEQVQQLSEQSLLQLSLQSADVGRVLAPHIQSFVRVISERVSKRKVLMTFGELDPPFGTHRLKVVELMMGMVGNHKLIEVTKDKLIESNVAAAMYDQFFQYKWNSMLHSLVERYVTGVLEYATASVEGESFVKATLFDATLLDRILHHVAENKHRSMGERDGFMGSVIVMVNAINTFFTRRDQHAYVAGLAELLSEEWKEYVKTELPLINEKYERPLGGHRPNNNNTTDDEEDFDVGGDCGGDINQDLAYMRFLSQQISSAPSNDDFLSSSSEEESDLSDEISDEDEGDRIFRPAVLEDAFAPDALGQQQTVAVEDTTNDSSVIDAAFGRATINNGLELEVAMEAGDDRAGRTTSAFAGDDMEVVTDKAPEASTSAGSVTDKSETLDHVEANEATSGPTSTEESETRSPPPGENEATSGPTSTEESETRSPPPGQTATRDVGAKSGNDRAAERQMEGEVMGKGADPVVVDEDTPSSSSSSPETEGGASEVSTIGAEESGQAVRVAEGAGETNVTATAAV